MQFVCNSCKAKYTISADRVQGRVLKIRCRECGEILEIRGDGLPAGKLLDVGRKKAGSSKDLSESYKLSSLKDRFKESFTAKGTGQLPANDPLEQPTAVDEFPRMKPARPGAPRETKDPKRWYVAVRNQPVGPVSKTKVRSYLRRKEIEPGALVWREGFDDWKPLGSCPELVDLVEELERPAAPEKPPEEIVPPRAPLGPGPGRDDTEVDAMRGFYLGRIDAQQDVAEARMIGDAIEHDVFRPAPMVAEPRPPLLSRLFHSRIALISIGAIALLIPFGITMLVLGLRTSGEDGDSGDYPVVVEEEPLDDHSERGNILAGLTITLEDVIEEELAAERGKQDQEKTNGSSGKPKSKKASTSKATDDGGMPMMPTGIQEKSVSGLSSGAGQKPSSGLKGQNGLSDQQLYKVVKNNSKSIQKCYEKVLGKGLGTKEDIKVKVRVNVGSSGVVTKVKVIQITNYGNFLTPCIEKGIKGWIFPRADAPSEFIFPVLLTPKT
jgi:predicted Zn finger-like uncharacterized protein